MNDIKDPTDVSSKDIYTTIVLKIRVDRLSEFMEYIKKFGTFKIDKKSFTDEKDAEMAECILDDDKIIQ